MKLILSMLCGVIAIASMSSCTTYVDRGRGHSSGYHRSSSHRSYSSRQHYDRHDRDRDSSTRVRTNVRGPLGISSGVGVDVR